MILGKATQVQFLITRARDVTSVFLLASEQICFRKQFTYGTLWFSKELGAPMSS